MAYEVQEESVQDRGQAPSGNRLSVYEAAEVLGVTVDAIRKRIQRGTIPYERDDGRVWVVLEASSSIPDDGHGDYRTKSDELVDELRGQVRYLREMLDEERDARRRVDTIIAQLTQTNAALAGRVPELEVQSDKPEQPPPRSSAEAQDDSEGRKESRWRRLFEG
jgi:excisionase family DNA binding protein